MEKKTIALTGVAAGILIGFAVAAIGLSSAFAGPGKTTSYAEDRAQIEDLQARYLFALDFKDHDLYVTTFTTEGVLDIGNGSPAVGREAIRNMVANMPGGHHHITNIVIKVDGDKATSRSGWLHTGKDAEGKLTLGGYGHYEDDLVKVDGQWLFAKRRIYNEGNAQWAAPPGNPAW